MNTNSLIFIAAIAISILASLLVYWTERKDGNSHESSLALSFVFIGMQTIPSAINFVTI